MNIFFLGGFFPEKYSDLILSKSKLQVQNSANRFQWAFIKGLEHNLGSPIKLITAPFIGWYPKYYKDYRLKTTFFSNGNNINNNIMVGFCNLPIIKNIYKYFNLSFYIRQVISSDEANLCIVYSLNIPYLKAAINAKNNNPNLKVCVIIPDLHEFPGDASIWYKWYIKYYEKPSFYKLISKIDCFVVIADKMVDYLNIGHKPWVRIEGLYENENSSSVKLSTGNKNIKVILYTGTLDYQYGIQNLLDAFRIIKSIDYQLWICGGGVGDKLVRDRALLDDRIKHFGLVSRQKVSELQTEATILINPRNTDGEYNKYSFPSKTMEYFASGTPTLMYKLDGIPSEYFEYCYTINDNKVTSLADAMYNICQLDSAILMRKGSLARDFIIKYKNAEVQCKKVINMIDTIKQ